MSPNGTTKIVVFTGDLAYSVRRGIVEIDAALPAVSWLIVLHSPRKALRRVLRNQWGNLKRNGWRWIPYQVTSLWDQVLGTDSVARDKLYPGGEFTRAALEARSSVRITRVDDINSVQSQHEIRSFAPDLGLALASPILRRETFSIPKLGTLNLHKGRLPDYRGMPPAFWELWNNEGSVGCTVHWVDDRLDTGPVVREGTVLRSLFSTVRGLQLQLDEVGVRLMRDAVSDVLSGAYVSKPQVPQGRTYRKPTLGEAAKLEARLSRSQAPRSPGPIRALKATRSAVAYSLWRAGLDRFLRARVSVLLYHRVSDEARDNLTVGIEQFDRQMALLRRRCRPLSLPEILSNRVLSKSREPLVVVTFDDGYLDNYTNAVPILRRHGIPAAFFVATGIIGTDGRFPHDVRRGNAQIPVMHWQHLREILDWGFVVGSHSASHIDCASEPEDRVRRELVDSREALRRELGIAEPIFAYPYGGRNNMTSQRLELVRQAGYIACLSAYGGANVETIDSFNVLRRGINWEFSDSAFLFECLGL